MSKIYKLLKDLPDAKKGKVRSVYNWEKFHCIYPKEHPDWFAQYILTTEDGVDIYVGDQLSPINTKGSIGWLRATESNSIDSNWKYFSTEIAAKKWQKEQEAKQHLKYMENGLHEAAGIPKQVLNSDLDIEKTCVTCKHEYQPKELEFEVGKWYEIDSLYILTTNKTYFISRGDTTVHLKGFYNNVWFDDMNVETRGYDVRLADMEKVKKLLKEKAKKDYPEGTKFRNLDTNSIRTTGKTNHLYHKSNSRITCGNTPMYEWESEQSNPYLFKDGKWAEIVEEPN